MTHPAYAHLDPRNDDMACLIEILKATPGQNWSALAKLQGEREKAFDDVMAQLDKIAEGK